MTGALLHLVFFLSGVSGLIYQVVWVREFGHAFGNTVYSASLVIAIFMLGLGAGGYLVGTWADRRYAHAPGSLLRAYGVAELAIAALGLAVSLALPHLGRVTAALSSYDTNPSGWYELSTASYAARAAIAVVLLAPVTLLMGGTLTLLIRHLVRANVDASGWKVAVLYGVNTAGAAAGAFVTDFALVPAVGLLATQMVAVGLNALAGAGALALARHGARGATPTGPKTEHVRLRTEHVRSVRLQADQGVRLQVDQRVPWTSIALALSGFAAMGMEILWLRHATLLLGGFRAVFSLLVTVVLVGMGAGALLGGVIDRRTSRPAQALMMVQALFVASALGGLAAADIRTLMAHGAAIQADLASMAPWPRAVAELWYNVRPILLEAGVAALLMGCSFPLANAVIQDAERSVGRRAGLLYLANTAGAVGGSLTAGYVLLPWLGMQASATALALAGALAIGALFAIDRRLTAPLAGATAVAGGALVAWMLLPGDFVLRRALAPPQPGERVVALSEGATELIAVTEIPGRGRGLLTNGHAMSSTARLDQRYMRALAHIPLLSMASPARVLVIGFGVGNTTHAASLHPSVERIEVADLSRHVLEHASYFADANHGVLEDPRVQVYLTDGRQHLQQQPPGSYDLITLEPPPISHAGVSALYSREFYELARTRLTPGGYVSQWLPAYQVPAESSLAMVRAFLDVFPQAVLLSGAQADLMLLGTPAPRLEIDPERLRAALAGAPAVQADLRRLDLGTPLEIVGTFVGSANTLARATRASPAMTDDRPLQEYGVRSALSTALTGVPASLFDLGDLQAWCPRCFDGDEVVPSLAGLETYLSLMNLAYTAPVAEVAAAQAASQGERRVLGSAYLGAILPDSDGVRNILALADYERGEALLEQQRFHDAADAFRAALRVHPGFAEAHNNLGVALASMGEVAEARGHFQQALTLEPGFSEARRNLEAASANR